MLAGIVAGHRNGVVALGQDGRLPNVCPQERVTRYKQGSVDSRDFPSQALDLLLARSGLTRRQVSRYVVAGPDCVGFPEDTPAEWIPSHLAHACAAYLGSPHLQAAVVVCDVEEPRVSVWRGSGGTLSRLDWPWTGPGFADVYVRLASALGFSGDAATQGLEALARLSPDARDEQIDALIRLGDEGLQVDDALERRITERLHRDREQGSLPRARVAAALQARLGDLLLEFLQQVRERCGLRNLCVGGDFFYRSSINSILKLANLFDNVFIPIDPGKGGLAVGAALHGLAALPHEVSPFLGPSYDPEEVKYTLDNCKLQYSWESESGALEAAVDALAAGRLVAWFDGAMEWGPRALGARSILADPRSPYVLENLNRFLKGRDEWRGYPLSGLASAVREHFVGPQWSPFMECDYRPRDPERFQSILPAQTAAVRIHTVSEDGPPSFRQLLTAFGDKTGLPILVNTSFNGFHEPIVCSPRDAVRVFYGSGIDVLVAGRFVLRK